MRICLVYDRFPPYTVGGVERWMRDLAVRLGEAGHEVTFLTMRHWANGDEPRLAGVRVVGIARKREFYIAERRALAPPVLFGIAVFRHLASHGSRYDIVHSASFPYFPLLAAAALRRRFKYRLIVDWIEVWTSSYWRSYAGPLVGTAGWLIQRLCIRVTQRAFCLSAMHVARLRSEGFRGPATLLAGIYDGPVGTQRTENVEPAIVYAGRHVKEKRVPALVRAFAVLRDSHPSLRLDIFGDGPERERIEELVAQLDLKDRANIHGRRDEEEVARAIRTASCLATASEREGYGLVVIEAAAQGTPSVVVAGPENAATELVFEGVNGAVAPNPEPNAIAAALVRVLDGGETLRDSTLQWFVENGSTLRLENSLTQVLRSYEPEE
jgi:glycosyltransferase involved in cell wall biosynthesis